jgi:competence protein ComEC
MTLFYFCIAWMAGIALAPLTGLPLISSLAAGACFFLFAFTVRKPRIPFLCLAFFLLGSARLSAAQPETGPAFIGTYLHRSAAFEVVLDEDPVPRGGGLRIRAHVDLLAEGGGEEIRDLNGAVLVEFRVPPDGWVPRYGDRVVLSGFLKPPPKIEAFDYADYLARQGVYGILEDPAVRSVSAGDSNPLPAGVFAFRRRALETMRGLFPEPEGALLAGILLGDESAIPADVQTAFSRTGTSHIVAISGFNITIVAGLFLALAGRLPRKIPGGLIAAAGIALYTVLVGAAASVVRSAVMGGMAILGRQLGRRSHGLTSLAFAGAAMTAANPWTVWDIGFQLSFAATLGLILYADPLQGGAERWLGRHVPKEKARALASAAGEVFLMTIAAQIPTLPLILLYFQSLSLSSFAVNPLILSVQPMVMIGGGLALLVGMLWLPAGRALAWAGWAPAAYTIRVVEWGADFSTLWWPLGSIPPAWIAAFYLALFGWTALIACNRLPPLEWGKDLLAKASAAALPILAAGAFLAWGAYFRRPDGRLHLTMISAGGGQAFLLRTPAGGTVLIDAGGDSNLVVSGLGRIIGFGPQRLDWVVVGSTAVETTSALAEIAARFEIGGVLLPAGTDRERKPVALFLARCGEKGVAIHEAEDGYRLDLGRSANLAVLARSGEGMILAVEYGRSRWLILDGLAEEDSRRMLAQGRVPDAQIVVFPLSIKKTGGLVEWLRAVRPLAGLWPFAEDLGWPDGISLMRADARGWVDLSTDGERMWVSVER